MNIKEYDSLKSNIKFYSKRAFVYFDYEGNIYEVNSDTLNNIKQQLECPYKIEFNKLPINIVVSIIESLSDEDTDFFVYRVKNPKTNDINYYAIINEKQKIKKLENLN